MPWTNVTTGKSLDPEDRKIIAESIASALQRHIGKNPAGVFVSFTHADEFYWGGVSSDDAAMFDVRWIGEFSEEQKSAIASEICGDLASRIGFESSRTRVVFTSKASEDWGRPG